MKNFTKYVFLTALFSISLTLSLFAQEQTDSSQTEETYTWQYHQKKKHKFHRHFHFSENFFDMEDSHSPFITLFYGQSEMKMNDLNASFNKFGFGQVKIGYSDYDSSYNNTGILRLKSHYIDINAGSKDFYESKESNRITANMLELGLGWGKSYGYTFGNSNLVLSHSYGIGWTRMRVDDTITSTAVAEKLDLYHNSFRFGINSEAGIQAQIIPHISVDAAYNRALVFPRVLFWKTAGSMVTEFAGYWLVDEFVQNIFESTPVAAPIVNFILKNGIAYGMYELRKDKVNFPFGGESPLMANTYKIGLTFSF